MISSANENYVSLQNILFVLTLSSILIVWHYLTFYWAHKPLNQIEKEKERGELDSIYLKFCSLGLWKRTISGSNIIYLKTKC
jgi:hypothetical protein